MSTPHGDDRDDGAHVVDGLEDNSASAPSMAAFFTRATETFYGRGATHIKVLDFGCGKGALVRALVALGCDAYGCDIDAAWSNDPAALERGRLQPIASSPYRLPFEDDSFDIVTSQAVLEHAQNTEECFREIHRVLKPGGIAMHVFPGKWYLPSEPHVFVPLLNFFWPRCPRWWLALWAMVGVRNEFQRGDSWRTVVDKNLSFCREGLIYLSNREHRRLSLKVFGNYSAPMDFYIENSPGGLSRLFRRLPFKNLSGWMLGHLRWNFVLQRKTAGST